MARLRISVIADQAPPPDPKDGCPYDIVFSQDVISRHAQVERYFERAEPADSLRCSRRGGRDGDRRPGRSQIRGLSGCPVQSAEGWSYLTALATVFRGDWDRNASKRLLPVRQLDFRDGRTAPYFRRRTISAIGSSISTNCSTAVSSLIRRSGSSAISS